MYGAQTTYPTHKHTAMFENDVEMYGAQTLDWEYKGGPLFENDVEMYGAQTWLMVFTPML